MIDRLLRDIVNLLIYGGFFIALCASCITALSLEIHHHVEEHFLYTLWIGVCTGALYCGHRVIGLKKMAHIQTSERFNVIRRYEKHIWTYFVTWILLAIVMLYFIGSFRLLIWMLPGGFIAIGYILPLFFGQKRLRDLGWGKIIMIGWSWAWLTSFVPLWFLAEEPAWIAWLLTLERMIFIMAITIPFEIRDIEVDRSVGLTTLPEKFGQKGTKAITWISCISIVVLSYIPAYYYGNYAYFITMSVISVITFFIIQYSHKTREEYFFGGLTDGLMIIALLCYQGLLFLKVN